ncbi:hypothetical protein [Ruminococcus sp.]
MAAPYRANHQHKVKEELQKNQLQSGVGVEYSAPLLLQKNVWAFCRRLLFLFK